MASIGSEAHQDSLRPALQQILWRQNQNDHRNASNAMKHPESKENSCHRQDSEIDQERRMENVKSRASSRPAPSQMPTFQASYHA